MPRPSLSSAERAQRRGQVLAAAHRLYRERQELPTVAEIAEAAGVAKGTVYLSFRTKEEIFVAPLEDGFSQLLAAVLPILRSLPASAPKAAAALARLYPRQLAAVPDLLPLSAMANAVLEKNLPLAAMLEFKRAVHESMDQPFQGDNLPELPRMRPPPGPKGTRLRIRSRLKPAGPS